MPNPTSPMMLQQLLGDLSGRRALAMALRAREQGEGREVSGKYVPNLKPFAGAMARGIYGDPLDEIAGQEQKAFGDYENELAGATEGVLGMDPMASNADFARNYARGQRAGVDPAAMQRAMKHHRPLDYALSILKGFGVDMDGSMGGSGGARGPTQATGGQGTPTGAGTGAPAPRAQVNADGSGSPGQAGPGGSNGTGAFARDMAPAGGRTMFNGVDDGKLLTIAAFMDKDDPVAHLVTQELADRKVEIGRDGAVSRAGQIIGFWNKDKGIYTSARGETQNVSGGAIAAQEGAEAGAKAKAEAAYKTITVPQAGPNGSETQRTMPLTQFLDSQQPPAASPVQPAGPGRVNLNLQNATLEDAQRALQDMIAQGQRAPAAQPPQAAPAPMGAAPAPQGQPGVGANSIEAAQAKAQVDTTAAGVRATNEDFVNKSYRPTIDAGVAARETIAQLEALDRLPIKDKTSWTAPAKALGARILVGLGVAPDDARKYASQYETFKSVSGQMVWGLLNQAKGMQTEGDAKRAAAVYAQFGNTPQGNQFVNDLARAVAMQRAAKAEFFAQAMPEAQKTGNFQQIEQAWQQQQPSIFSFPHMQNWGGDAAGQPQGGAAPARNPQVDAVLQKYGFGMQVR